MSSFFKKVLNVFCSINALLNNVCLFGGTINVAETTLT